MMAGGIRMKKLLVVVDYQNDFIKGGLAFPQAVALENGLCDIIKKYVSDGNEVVFTMDTHQKDYLSTYEGKHLPVEHCISGTEGWELYGKVKKLFDKGNFKIFKKSTFGSFDLAEYVKKSGFHQIEFVGIITYICVLSNVLICKAACPEAEVAVYRKLVASPDNELNDKTLDVLRSTMIVIKDEV
jgi:nicotinamidase-related amidase